MKIVKRNTNVSYHYEILEEYVAGIILEGYEIKPIKSGFISFSDSYVSISGNKVILKNFHINLRNKSISNVFFDAGKYETRDRQLLLNKYEIEKLKQKIYEKRLTLIPLEIILNKSLIKVKLGVCKGKKLYEKKRELKEKDIKREMDREIKNYK